MMSLLKDLLYTKDNKALDIARASSALSVLAFWGAVLWQVGAAHQFSPMEVGSGCAAIMAGAAAWIYARQKHEEAAGEAKSAD